MQSAVAQGQIGGEFYGLCHDPHRLMPKDKG